MDPSDVKEPPLADWQQRVVDEKDQLSVRIDALSDFMDMDKFESLPFEEQNDLRLQREIMNEYYDILRRRIFRFNRFNR